MATKVITASEWGFAIRAHPSEIRESTGWKQQLKEKFREIFKGHGENLFDGY
ncbi:MAG: hypothetical protein JOZ80_07410 [Acidobacteriaceae bacterium]|nr:hypothetical protein [Acidobacteriaceae bacterium]